MNTASPDTVLTKIIYLLAGLLLQIYSKFKIMNEIEFFLIFDKIQIYEEMQVYKCQSDNEINDYVFYWA